MIFSAQEDIDSRTGERRYLIDEYHIHANAIDVIRLSLMDTTSEYILFMNDDNYPSSDYWAEELWQIDKALRALGIED